MIRPEDMVKIESQPAPSAAERLFSIRRSLDKLIQDFWGNGLVVTVELVPQKPLAMGNYKPVVSVRVRRS